MTQPTLPPDVFDALPPAVQAYIRFLEARVGHLEVRLAHLEARLDQNSSNSSKPPSSDGPHVKPAPPQSPSGRKRGGQPGHPKHERVILPPDEVIDHKPTRCHACHAALAGDDPQPILDQVSELPEKLRFVTHHRRHTLICACCAALTTAPVVPAAGTGFGPRLTAATAYLSGVGRLGKRAIRTLFDDLCGIPVSLGSVSKLEATVSRALEPIHAAAHAHAKGLDANVDETGWKQGKAKAWLWVAVTKSLTVFLIRPNRNRAAFDDLVGPTPGVLTTDRFPVYTHLAGAKRQVCWAHLRRDFQAMVDRADAGSAVGRDLLLHADILLAEWRRVREGVLARSAFASGTLAWLRPEVAALLAAGAASAGARTAGVCASLRAIEASLYTFASVEGVEPTNNAAERALRHAVCWRKTSGGTDGASGSRFVERVLTVVASSRQQGRDVLAVLTEAVQAARTGATPPSLVPAGA